MKMIEEGSGELLGWHDPDEAYEWVTKNKSKNMKDKQMTLSEAVNHFIQDNTFIVFGGFGHIRVSMGIIYEIIRQEKRGLSIAAKPGVHDTDILIASECVSKIEVAYAFGHELRGLSPASRRSVEEGKVQVTSEISNAGFQWRLQAAAMGIPFMPTRTMLGSDTLRFSSAKVVKDPFSGKPICLVPACYPDVGVIHVHRCDKFGNAQIDGITVMDLELASAARRLIITTEKIINTETIRNEPWKTAIPFYLVDSVIEIPYGSHPGNMPYLYYSDEDHFTEWLKLSKTNEGVQEYFNKYVYNIHNYTEYLELIGGHKKIQYLEQLEKMKIPLHASWAER